MDNILAIIIGIIIGIIYIEINFDNIPGNSPRYCKLNYKKYIRNCHLYINNKHIHHWILCSIIYLLLLYFYSPYLNCTYCKIVEGFLYVCILQGLSYPDFLNFD